MRVVLLVFAFGLIGCATAHKINNVEIGMTKAQVIAVMGKPVSVSATSGVQYLNYSLYETSDDAERGWGRPYYVRLVNGKVDSYGRSGDFDSTKKPESTVNINVKNAKSDD